MKLKLSRQAEVKEETLVKAHDPEAFLTQVADTLQASLLRSGKVRAELFGGQSMIIRGATTRTKRDTDHTTLVEVTLDIQTLAEYLEYQLGWYIEGKFTNETGREEIERFIAWLKPLDIQPSSD